jgi:hypothetical protein
MLYPWWTWVALAACAALGSAVVSGLLPLPGLLLALAMAFHPAPRAPT